MYSALILAAAVIRLGQMLLFTGATRSNSAAGASARLLLDLAVATLTLWAIGGIWVPDVGEMRFITFGHALGISVTSSVSLRVLPLLLLATGGIVGATQDRVRSLPMLLLTAALAGVIFPLLMQIEVRLNKPMGVADTGIGLAAIIGGTAALSAAWVIGQRKGKFNRDLSANVLPGHHVPMQYFGVLVIAIGLAFADGDGANVLLGVSAAALAGAAYGRILFRKIDTGLMLASTLAGAVAASTIGGLAPTWATVLAAVVAGAITPWVLMKIETVLRIDDAGGSAAGLFIGGLIGLIAAPLFQSDTTFGARLESLTGNGIMFVIAAGAAAIVAILICQGFKAAKSLRLNEGEEFEGIDLAEFDLNAYPDFQQTMIKSHHLRQI